ncbi:MAG: riboflavin synthase, partial [Alphaproteobacteria bacterium]|nr:riboflavin synthase [Alphaproteobacteria bacterium]
MFTGIVQDIGTVRCVDRTRGDLRFEIKTNLNLESVPLGASICCSGCCLTVVEKTVDSFSVDVSAETLSKTSLGEWKEGTQVNLEPSLKMGDELGGHFVFGHIDAVTRIIESKPEGDSHRLKIALSAETAPFIAPKGSVALDGISLTVNEVKKDYFGVNIIPHTWEKTTLGQKIADDKLNIEIDMLARYVSRA